MVADATESVAMNPGDLHVVFNGSSRLLKCFLVGSPQPVNIFECHDVGVNDQNITAGEDEYGHLCKCPPGLGYILGEPQELQPPEPPYGYAFTPIEDDPAGEMLLHGREGIGIHGGGSDLPNPFAPRQGWEWTFGCLRLQNIDNAAFASLVESVLKAGHKAILDVVWKE